MQVVVDADVLIAGTLAPTGASAELLDRWAGGEFELIVCPHLLEEVRKTLLHPRVGGKYGISDEDVESLVQRLGEEGLMSEDPRDPPRVVPGDPGEDYLVALALGAEADGLVTRDRHFEKVRIPELPILTPRDFLKRLGVS